MPLESLFAFGQSFLDFQCSGLKMTAESTAISSETGLAGKRPLILENEAKYIGVFSLLSPLLENVFAFAQFTFYYKYSGLKMKERGR